MTEQVPNNALRAKMLRTTFVATLVAPLLIAANEPAQELPPPPFAAALSVPAPDMTASLALPAAADRPVTLRDDGEIFALRMPPMPRDESFALDSALPDELPRPNLPSILGLNAEYRTLFSTALTAYRRGARGEGDALAARIEDDDARTALEWSAIRMAKTSIGFARLNQFLQHHPQYPMTDWVARRAEDALLGEKKDAATVEAFFANRKPEMASGKIVMARLARDAGNLAQAQTLVKSAWRENNTSESTRALIQKDFPGAINEDDVRFLAERLIYNGDTSDGVRVASKAGGTVLTLAQLLSHSVNETGGAGAILAKLDAVQAKAPAALFARSQMLRRANKPVEAASALLQAPRELDKIVDGDEWWVERRMVSRKLLDAGEFALAYKVSSGHSARSPGQIVDAEVHSGWIALRYLQDTMTAGQHFDRAREAATTPSSMARAAYWQGRAALALNDRVADMHFLVGAQYSHTFYGQLSLAALGSPWMPATQAPLSMEDREVATRSTALRGIRMLLDSDARDLAQPLVLDLAKNAQSYAEISAMGDLVRRYGLTRMAVLAGKVAMQRGFAAEEMAFPTVGIPEYQAMPASAGRSTVFSIARQESEFDAGVISHAGARGLMQLMPATAQRTASRNRIAFDVGRLTRDPGFNAQIGAAHLAELMQEYNGSLVLTFAAYNAGGGRVKEWLEAYGDPRRPDVDPIDWIERIPISETRHYVQKILENLQVYRAQMDGRRSLNIMADLTSGKRETKLPFLADATP